MKNKMQFKNFQFEINPAFIEIRHSRNVNNQPLVNGKSKVQNGAVLPVEIHGNGFFFGDKAAENAAVLEMLHKKTSAGWLYLPEGQAFNVFFKELKISFDSMKNRYNYSFVFVENVNGKMPVYDFEFTVAGENENLYQISNRCNISVDCLIQLNDYKNPFEVRFGDRVVLK